MKTAIYSFVLAGFGALSGAQAPPAAPAPGSQAAQLGFTYAVPSNWQVLSTPPTMSATKSEAATNGSEEEKKGLACLEPVLTARDPGSGSILSVEALPFACFGQTMTNEDLPGFAAGAPEVLRQSFDLGQPLTATYALGSHSMWVERASATLKDHPEVPFTVEIACGLLKKAAVCWMAVAGSDDALHAFERGSVTLDGESAGALVPPTAFDKKPS
jgi:hypothetical protein